jgi:long-subunit fatty acid transport protein
MKKFTGAGIALLLGTTAAYAGGMDRSGQSITALFEEGTYAEISFGSVSPDVSGIGLNAINQPGASSGSVAPDYTQVGFAFKTDLNEDWSLAIIMDQPFGANVDYATPGYIVYESGAEVKSTGFTILAQYHVDENVSVYGGPRMVRASGFYQANDPLNGPGVDYRSDYSSDTDVGFVLGAAYEIPEIALRAAVTYSSETSFEMDGTAGDLTATMPQSVNVDFQTGIAANTLAFANIRWAEWSEATVDDTLAGNLADFGNEDVTTYTVGVGRRFTDNFAAQFAVSYEKDFGAAVSNLAPTDGYISYSLGGAYTFTNGMELSGGIRYVDLGDATTENIGSSFTDNSATAIGLKLAYNY